MAYVAPVRTLLMLLAGGAIGLLVAWVVLGSPFGGRDTVTKAQIEQAVAKRPRGRVRLVLCNAVAPPQAGSSVRPPQTWTCDTYLGRTIADQTNGPSYLVTVAGGHIASIRPAAAN